MYDKYNRKINYLRISVTDRCNLRCIYCMPAEGIKLIPHQEILSFDEIFEVAKVAVSMGVDKIRITGGEPLVRKDIIILIKMIASIEGIKDFGLTTNGIYLTKYAQQLADAGLHRVNISLDTMNPEKYKQITRRGNINDVFKGIEAAKKAGLNPIKINCVIQESSLEPDAQDVANFCRQNDLKVRFIREMDLETGQFWRVQGGDGGECKICNRLRLTSNGKIRPCLFSDLEYDIRKLGAEKAISLAVGNKPKSGTISKKAKFSNIGG
ncbi:MAG: GTP 3',8-cyclase MoaA [Bacteroidales bacterium]|nr:GTP 3',8-cyclase MoaA [Bacteroidales bacterium]MBN2758355.1 GTP 3',8-cyclase MoaA [Bacteroidales bacterium]